MIDLAHLFVSLDSALKEHESFLRAVPDDLTMANVARHPDTLAVATAQHCRDVWTLLDAVYSEQRTLATIAQDGIDKANQRGSTYATSFFNAVHRVDGALKLTDTRFRETLASHRRALHVDELARVRGALDAIAAAQAGLMDAHAVYESMSSPAGGPALAIAFT